MTRSDGEKPDHITEEMVARWADGEDQTPSFVESYLRERIIEKRVATLRELSLDALIKEFGNGPVPPSIQVSLEILSDGAEVRLLQQLTLKGLVNQLRDGRELPQEVVSWLIDSIIDHERYRLQFVSIEGLIKLV